MAISSILRQISYSFNTNFCYSKLRFCKKSKKEGEGGGGRNRSPLTLPLLLNNINWYFPGIY